MRRPHAWFLLALALGACSSQDRTRLAVTVYSDLSIPLEIDTLRIEVQGPTGAPQQVEYALATQPTEGKVTLPVQTILVPQGKKDDTFTVTAGGIKDRTAVITRSARLSFIPGDARELIIFLNRDCYQRTCVGDKTCIAGNCVSNTVNSQELPTYTTNMTGKAASPDASSSNQDTAPGETGVVDGQAEVGATGDARLLADRTGDRQGDEAGTTQDAPDMPFDLAADTSTIPVTDAALPPTDSAPTRLADSGPVIVGPDGATPDTRPGLDTPWPNDTTLTSDTPLPSPDTAVVSLDAPVVSPDAAVVTPDTPPASPDTQVDVPCPPGCDPGAKRCSGPTGVETFQTCGNLPNGCTDWGVAQTCGTHQSCKGTAPAAACECKDSGSSKCPLPGDTTGNFCESTELLQSCNRDTDGCFYLGTPQTCAAVKPCTGADGSASCSCGPTTAPCGTDTGTYCGAGNTQVVSCSYVSGCMVTTPVATCPTGKPCAQTGQYAAECKCPIVAACDSASEMNRSYCSSNTVITCGPDANNCQKASPVDCQTNQVCQASGNTASCVCINAHCLNPSGGTFDQQACDTDARVLTCGTVEACPGITATDTCATGTVCRASAGVVQCMPTLGWYTDFGGTGSRGSSMLIGHQVLLTVRSRLVKFGLIARSTASAVMALYADGGSLVASNQSPITADRNEFAPATATTLEPGRYWIMANYSATVDVAQKAGSSVERRSISHTYGAALPPNLTGASTVTGTQSNIYIVLLPE